MAFGGSFAGFRDAAAVAATVTKAMPAAPADWGRATGSRGRPGNKMSAPAGESGRVSLAQRSAAIPMPPRYTQAREDFGEAMPATVADRVVSALIDADIDKLYCLPGYQNDDFFDALYDVQHLIKPVHTRHEQGAAYMALGAAMATGRPQACCVVPGPGFLNTGAALATAWAVNAPVVMIVGQTPLRTFGMEIGELHEIPDQLAIIKQFCKAAVRIDDASRAASQIADVMAALTHSRPRPVAIEVPMDVWTLAAPDGPEKPDLAPPKKPTPAEIRAAANEITNSRRPLIVVGGGAVNHGESILDLAAAIDAPVMSSRSGRGIVSADSPFACLCAVGRVLWPQADCVIGLGTRIGSRLAFWGSDEGLRSVHIDVDESELERGRPADLRVNADLVDALPLLAGALSRQPDRSEWAETAAAARAEVETKLRSSLAPQTEYLDVIRSALPSDGILVADVTQIGFAAEAMFPVRRPRTYLSSGYQGTLGWSIPTALGASSALDDRAVIVIAGDGGAMFNIQELATAKLHNIPFTLIIFDDRCFGNVRRFQIEKYGNRVIASDLHSPDFVALAASCGLSAQNVSGPDELSDALQRAVQAKEPRVITVEVGDFPSPWSFLLPRPLRGPQAGAGN